MWQSLLNWFGGNTRPETDPQKVLALALRQVGAAIGRVRQAQAQAEARRREVQNTLQTAQAQHDQLWEEAKLAHRQGNQALAHAKMQAKTTAEAKLERLRQLHHEAAQHEQTLRQQLTHLQLKAEELKNKESLLATRLASAETLADLHQKLDQLGATAQVEALEDAVNRAETFSQLLTQELATSAPAAQLAAELHREAEQERQKAEAEQFERIGKLFADTPEKLAQMQKRQQQLAQHQAQQQQGQVEAFFSQVPPAKPAPDQPADLPPGVEQFFTQNNPDQKAIDDFFKNS
ncbi:MAG: PspA/IM30 family protein [Bernardetiaceae bacterium]|jgi:phage shock protein A|nr:PspA/IM30 family protein [Bernardetiaceae bacterium]